MDTLEMLTQFNTVYEQIRHEHHITGFYAVHKALGKFYEQWSDLTDNFIETYQGKYGNIEGSFAIAVNSSKDIKATLAEANSYLIKLNSELSEQDEDLKNIVADMMILVNHTFYLLTLK